MSGGKEWILTSAALIKVVSAAQQLDRYLSPQGALLNPRVNRKALITEERNGIILTEEQHVLIHRILENPNDWYELMMGLGKTSVIFPMILLLLAEKGFFAIGVVKEELLRQNVESLDKSARLMLEAAGIEFTFDMESDVTPAVLAEQYYRLLKVKEESSFPITTLPSRIYLTHCLSIVDGDLKKAMGALARSFMISVEELTRLILEGKIPSENLDPKLLRSISHLERQRYWLTKIRNLMIGNEKENGFKTLNFIDEIDSVVRILKEVNVAKDDPKSLNLTIYGMMELLMNAISTSDDPDIQSLQKALATSQQATLVPQDVKDKILPKLVKSLYKNKDFLAFVGCQDPDSADAKTLEKMGEKAFVEYICSILSTKETPLGPWQDKSDTDVQRKQFQNGISALKSLIQKTLPTAFKQTPGIDIGVKNTDGYTVAPRTNGQEMLNTLYGDEYDLIANEVLTYYNHIPENAFNKKALKEYQQKFPDDYQKIENAAVQAGVEPLAYLNRKEHWKERLAILRTTIIQNNLIRRYKEQYKMNVQEAVEGSDTGGFTGTLKKRLLPNTSKPPQKSQQTECVIEAETLLRAALTQPKIEVVEEDKILDSIGDNLKNPECKVILNEGSDLGNMVDLIRELRKKDGGKNRIFVFTHHETRLANIWYPTDEEPKGVSKEELNKLPLLDKKFKESCVFCFNPADKIGTDYRIPTGFGLLIPGPTTRREGLAQIEMRERDLGFKHGLKGIIPKGIATRICQQKNKQEKDLTYFDLFGDVMNTSLEEEKGLNIKATFQKITSIVTIAARDINYAPEKTRDTNEFWDFMKSNDLIADSYINTLLAEAFDPLFIQSKEVNFADDFAPTTMQQLEDKVKDLYTAEKKKLEEIHAKLDKPLEALSKAAGSKSVLIQNRIKDIRARLENLKTKLELSEKAFFEKEALAEHKKHLPEKILTSGNDTPNSQEQVQTQQQTQQQQIKPPVPIRGVTEEKNNIYYSDCGMPSVDDIKPSHYSKRFLQVSKLSLGSCFDDELLFSDHMEKIYKLLPLVQGDPIGRLCIQDDRVYLIGNLDYLSITKFGIKTNDYTGIYSLLNGALTGKGISMNISADKEPNLNDIELRKKIFQMKILLGFSQFSKDELEDGKAWLDTIKKDPRKLEDLYTFIRTKGNEDQRILINKLL